MQKIDFAGVGRVYHIEQINVVGFRGQKKDIKISLSADANFLIGRNGTGKTTLINLIAHILQCDFLSITKHDFEEVIITLNQKGSRKKPKIAVRRTQSHPFSEFQFSIKETSKAVPVVAYFSDPEFQWWRHSERFLDHAHEHDRSYGNLNEVKETLDSLFNVSWLALNRSAQQADDEDESFSDHIDAKLFEVIGDLSSYFSRLDRRVSVENTSFQRNWFLSFLTQDGATSPSSVFGLDDQKEKEALEKIFRGFLLPEGMFKRKLDRHFLGLKKAKDSFNKEKRLMVDDFLTLSDTYRLHKLVEIWYKLQEDQKSIYLPKTEFIDILNRLFFNKVSYIDSSNLLQFNRDDGINIRVSDLSSGEKQMIIFLSQALLQEGRPHIFIADEPELSLHVDWQECLVDTIKTLNPLGQIFFATHSPDIVSTHTPGIIDMEALL